MKNYILIILLCFCIQTQAQETKEYTCEELQDFSEIICAEATSLSRGDSISKAGEIIEAMFIKMFGIDKNDPNYKQLVAAVYNKYADCFICRDKPTKFTRNPEQFMKRVVSLGMYESILDDFLLYDNEEYPINVNTIEIVNGEPETFLDYLNKILADPKVDKKYDVKEIKSLRRYVIEDYNAKTAAELKQ